MTHDAISLIQAVVRDELRSFKTAELGVVTKVYAHEAASDKNNYECDVRLRNAGLELKGVPVCTARSGAVAMGLSAINWCMGMKWGENTPEDFVRYVRNNLMGLSREDLVYDIACHVDSAVHMFEDWGLPFFKTEDGRVTSARASGRS